MKPLRFILTLCLALVACFAAVDTAQAAVTTKDNTLLVASAQPAHMEVATPAKSPLSPISSLSLLGLGFAGATDEKPKRKKLTLRRAYLFNGETFGPGRDVEVPGEFPELDAEGNVKHPDGSLAAKNAAASRPQPLPAGTSPLESAETVSGKSFEELSDMRKAELEALALESNVEVSREDGEDGDPLVEDYVRALSAPKTA